MVGTDSPIGTLSSPVEFWFALFAVVLIRQHGFIQEAHTAAMLPNTTFVALNKEIAGIIGQGIGTRRLLLSQSRRGPRIFSLTADTTSDLLFYSFGIGLGIFLFCFNCWLLFFAITSASTRCHLLRAGGVCAVRIGSVNGGPSRRIGDSVGSGGG